MGGGVRGEMEKKMGKCLLVTVAGLLNSSRIEDTCVLSTGAFLNLTFENTTSKTNTKDKNKGRPTAQLQLGAISASQSHLNPPIAR